MHDHQTEKQKFSPNGGASLIDKSVERHSMTAMQALPKHISHLDIQRQYLD
jgi:hypothetical protein